MKILITVEGEKVTVEIDSKQLELPLFSELHGPDAAIHPDVPRPKTLAHSENIKENPDGTLSPIDPSKPSMVETNPEQIGGFKKHHQPPTRVGRPPKNPQMHDPLGTQAERDLAHKVNDNFAPASEFEPIVPGSPKWATASRDDAEEERSNAARRHPHDINQG